MTRALHAMLLRSLLLLALAVPVRAAGAEIANDRKVVEGMAFYLGVMPTELVRGHPTGHTEREMHGGPPSRAWDYHVMVAIFDAATGERITDAKVEALVETPGLGGQKRPLERMQIAGTLTYGNYFRMGGSGPFPIVLQVSRPGLPTAEVRFDHRHR